MRDIEEWLRAGAEGVALAAEAIGALIVAVAIVATVGRYARDLIGRSETFPQERLRLGVGRALALALEFLLAADIVRTAVAPSWDEIGKLAAIAAIRTALNFFLQREIAHEERRLSADREQPADA
jgi:uncharacterized membrane protein